MEPRVCTKCGKVGEACKRDFYVERNRKDGFKPECRDCTNAAREAWRLKNRDRLLERQRLRYDERTNAKRREKRKEQWLLAPYRQQAGIMTQGIRERSKKAGWEIPPELRTKVFFISWMKRQPNCPCCGVEFNVGPKNSGMKDDASPSIDRFSPDRPYELSNIRMICWRCNNIKRNYVSADLRRVARWMDQGGPDLFTLAAAE